MVSSGLLRSGCRCRLLHFAASMFVGFSSLALGIFLCSCSAEPSPGDRISTAGPNLRSFQVNGIITKLPPDGKSIEIRHEQIPNFMPAMTMPFDVKNAKEIAGLKVNDSVTFRLSVTDKDSWIDQIRKVEPKSLTDLPTTNGFRFVHDVDPLQVGDPLPEYHFTNQLGHAISTSQFKGQAIA